MHSCSELRESARRWAVVACFAVMTCLLLATPRRAAAHADMLIQIESATTDIRKDPGNPDLYIRRGQLYREHAEFDQARADFDTAETFSPGMQYLNFVRGKLYLEWGWPLTARGYIDRFLAAQPRHTDGLVLRARILQRLGLDRSAVSDFDLALEISPEPGPDLFVERSQLLMGMGNDHWPEALRGLDDGIKRLGSLVTLQLFAIDAEVKQQHYDGALARVDQIAARSPRKETWLARRGEILVQAGRPAEARKAYEGALAALNTLPPARRNVPAMTELAQRIQREIESLPK